MKCSIQLGIASLNRTFQLSPHENICTIALITIHYLYNTCYLLTKIFWDNNPPVYVYRGHFKPIEKVNFIHDKNIHFAMLGIKYIVNHFVLHLYDVAGHPESICCRIFSNVEF